MTDFDPSNANKDEVLEKLEAADEQERKRILTAERSGKKRKSILEAYGVDPDERVDANGDALYPWEVDPSDQVVAVQVDETEEQTRARQQRAEADEAAATEQPAGDPAGTGSAPGAGTAADGGGDTF